VRVFLCVNLFICVRVRACLIHTNNIGREEALPLGSLDTYKHRYIHTHAMTIRMLIHTRKIAGVIYNTGWRRCISCLKLQVALRQKVTNYYALLLWKMTYINKAFYGSSPPCTTFLQEEARKIA